MIPERLRNRLSMPAMVAPLFLVSGPDLVVASCKAGFVGSFPTLNQRTPEGLEQWLIEIRSRLDDSDAPFGAQFGIHRTNPRQAPDLALAIKYEVPIVITTLGITREITDAIHAYGGLVFHDATSVKHAVKAIDANVDGVIAVTQGAGGHAGTINPFAFLTELRPIVGDRILILAGAISNGRSAAGAIAAGADMVSLGTCFVPTIESMAPVEQKQMIVDSTAADIVYTDEISGIGASFLGQTLKKFKKANEPKKEFDVAEEISPKLWRDYWSAGQGVGGSTEISPARVLCERFIEDYAIGLIRAEAGAGRRATVGVAPKPNGQPDRI